ncbi:MAG: hypothetical protein KAI24_15065 [Planctomycetes bacterium]|nr:hypothetical protein [Planctomycetota bacterium]
MLRQNNDDFDAFRRDRKRVAAKLGPQGSVLGYENQALRELEQVEAREVREQQLTREVHDFFAAATKQAASIVEKVSHDAEQETGERVQTEMQGFLMDALTRMNTFIVTAMNKRQNVNVAEAQVEPDLKHIVGPDLDGFRYEGTPEVREAHIGQDPFATPVEDVQREFRAVVAEMEGEVPEPAPIEDHLVAEAVEYGTQEVPEELVGGDAAAEPAPAETHSEMLAQAVEDEEPAPTVEEELETFKNALRALVRQGVMQREEARAAWNARLVALGRAPQ